LKKSTLKEKILIADDEEAIVVGLSELLTAAGYAVASARDGHEALRKLKKGDIAVLLADLDMPFVNGLQIIEEIQKMHGATQVMIITGKGSISTAVQAMKSGAYDYLTKPVESGRILSLIPKALDHYRLLVSHQQLQQTLHRLTHFEDLIGQSQAMRSIYRMIETVADSTATVIITGESGTGKELVAAAIHKKSSRSQGPFIAVNCSAFPQEILENELFGHEKGAFTGAIDEKPGCFELAHHGTLFLDEVGEMSLPTQAKILRALEERRYRRLGGKNEIQVDVRVLAATNRDLKQLIHDGRFREDLYYRLCVVEMDIPPLRDRVEDIPLLAREFLRLFNERNNKQIKGFTPQCMELLLRFPWPGNVRELKNVIERTVILSTSPTIDVSNLPERLLQQQVDAPVCTIAVGTPLEQAEMTIIQKTLSLANNNKTHAARILGISLKTLHNKLDLYRMSKK
jgi:DNA-binding NtrC family response regulator